MGIDKLSKINGKIERLNMRLVNYMKDRKFVCYYHFIGLDNIQLGLSLNWRAPNIEIHLPFGFIKVGWSVTYVCGLVAVKTFGLDRKL